MLVAISAAHGRHALTRVWAKHTASLGFDMVVVAITGNGADDDGPENARTCLEHKVIWAEAFPNAPLAGKFNGALGIAMRQGATRIIIVPSDDFISPAWVEAAHNSKSHYMIPHSCGVYDLKSGEAYAIHKISLGVLKFGAGRVVSREAVEKCGGQLWPSELNKTLDTASHNRLGAHGVKPEIVTTPGVPITDVKTAENLWPFNVWKSSGRPLSEEDALHMLTPELKAELIALRK